MRYRVVILVLDGNANAVAQTWISAMWTNAGGQFDAATFPVTFGRVTSGTLPTLTSSGGVTTIMSGALAGTLTCQGTAVCLYFINGMSTTASTLTCTGNAGSTTTVLPLGGTTYVRLRRCMRVCMCVCVYACG